MTICIISHTEHYLNDDNQIVAWGPTVRELNHLLEIADKVIHLAPLHQVEAPQSSLQYSNHQIEFIPLKPSGGKGLKKLSILGTSIHNLKLIHQYTKTADFIQFRAPTGMGVYVLPYLRLFRNKEYWVKYAGNWMDANMPLGNRLQKKFLQHCISKNTKVTYNGSWVKKTNFLSFENPCLTDGEYQAGIKNIKTKTDPTKLGWEICFVGSLNTHKGVHLILEALEGLQNKKLNINTFHFVGDGPLRKKYEKQAEKIRIPIIFHGFLNKIQVNKVLSKSHALILPSKSEGFPKVIGEAMNYGCIPIVTDISCMKDYIKNLDNGILIQEQKADDVEKAFLDLASFNLIEFKKTLQYNSILALRFTYSYYNKMLKEKVFDV